MVKLVDFRYLRRPRATEVYVTNPLECETLPAYEISISSNLSHSTVSTKSFTASAVHNSHDTCARYRTRPVIENLLYLTITESQNNTPDTNHVIADCYSCSDVDHDSVTADSEDKDIWIAPCQVWTRQGVLTSPEIV